MSKSLLHYRPATSNSFGIKIKIPMTAAKIATINTAPAAASFAFFASGFRSSVNRSTVASTAVLTSSSARISPNRIKQIIHSVFDICSQIPKIVTKIAAAQCILIY